MRPILRPGTHVLNRLGGDLQVGLDPSRAVVLPDSTQVRRTLVLLAATAERDSYEAAGLAPTLEVLDRHALLVDERDVLPLLHREARTDHAAAALARARGSRSAAAWQARADCHTQVRVFGPEAVDLGDRLADVLAGAGLAVESADPEAVAAPPEPGPAHVGVLVGVGEPHREALDAWSRAGLPHLLVRLTEGRAVVGPFVAPGRTACLRCIDAHRTDADPSWPLLVRQYASAASRSRGDGVPEPVDPLLAALALAWAARDLATYVEGGRPSTWSTTVSLQPDLSEIETHAWLRHPACCCTWG